MLEHPIPARLIETEISLDRVGGGQPGAGKKLTSADVPLPCPSPSRPLCISFITEPVLPILLVDGHPPIGGLPGQMVDALA